MYRSTVSWSDKRHPIITYLQQTQQNLLQQVINLSPAQIEMLPEGPRQQVLQLKQLYLQQQQQNQPNIFNAGYVHT